MGNSPKMRLIAGLGNPGMEYQRTYHNIGFIVIDELCRDMSLEVSQKTKFGGIFIKGKIDSFAFGLFKPLKYMNRSGGPIQELLAYYKIATEDMLVIHDDIDLPLGFIRYRQKGGHGGHNGIRSIIQALAGGDFHRLKIGVGRGDNASDHVLTEMSPQNQLILNDAVDCVVGHIKNFITHQTISVSQN